MNEIMHNQTPIKTRKASNGNIKTYLKDDREAEAGIDKDAHKLDSARGELGVLAARELVKLGRLEQVEDERLAVDNHQRRRRLRRRTGRRGRRRRRLGRRRVNVALGDRAHVDRLAIRADRVLLDKALKTTNAHF